MAEEKISCLVLTAKSKDCTLIRPSTSRHSIGGVMHALWHTGDLCTWEMEVKPEELTESEFKNLYEAFQENVSGELLAMGAQAMLADHEPEKVDPVVEPTEPTPEPDTEEPVEVEDAPAEDDA